MATNQRAGHDASHAMNAAPDGQHTQTTAAPTPSTVAGATAGSANMFAGIAIRLTLDESAAMIGEHAAWAAAGTASASARNPGTPRASRAAAQPGASSISPAVAQTESANPASPASPG